MPIPIIDIFAGPGGLGEGFSALQDEQGERIFRISLSIEKDPLAHRTLRLRSFFRQFPHGEVPQEYYDFVRGEIDIHELYRRWPDQAAHAHNEAWCGTLGDPDEQDVNAVSDQEVDERISTVLEGERNWLLIGGPPCQAYSLVGRSRRQEKVLNETTDKRVGLYKQYLRILATHSPAVFVMENVKGILSAKTNEDQIFSRILQDLSDPTICFPEAVKAGEECPGYRIYSLTGEPNGFDENGNPQYRPSQFVVQTENYGIPQTRHRVILLGVRRDLDIHPGILEPSQEVNIYDVIGALPRLRSGLSKRIDSFEAWRNLISEVFDKDLSETDPSIIAEMKRAFTNTNESEKGSDFIPTDLQQINYRAEWFSDERLNGVLNHTSRSHMDGDIHRYLFVASFGKVKGLSPKLSDFPLSLLPAHMNVREGIDDKKFADRFRVQLENKASKTVTSHISKDGHYYIHPDGSQCRSLTVREAARIQTFPDNYFFCGNRTSQFHQVGNAVPPLLAYQIAGVVKGVFLEIEAAVLNEH
ncbi:hypothetical protein ASE74_09985 [Pedobacter sp. Leaf216]|uniref:DNA cytosine methyltransferase n=1 Tax=Pedobacter sp. Leaf216 TaxID=1735684 RepID=UPI0006FE7D04|nr:DNA cytosine methyltransferase [Pedobacter sp. Leaf216]KQM65192.1 hypothetical protein ASE74_09985 [Pedobacter sp. Leaf216]